MFFATRWFVLFYMVPLQTLFCASMEISLPCASSVYCDSTNYLEFKSDSSEEEENTGEIDLSDKPHSDFLYKIEQLKKHYPEMDWDASDLEYLIEASSNGWLDCVELLLTIPGIDVEIQDELGFTPLQRAAQNGHLEVVQALIEIGHAQIDNQGGSWQRTALHIAAENGHLVIVQYLVSRRANPNLQDKFSFTPLILATLRCNLKLTPNLGPTRLAENIAIALHLIENNTDLKLQDYNGHTVLHHAVITSLEAVIHALLVKNRSIGDLEDKTGRIALSYANNDSIKHLFRGQGCYGKTEH